MSDSSRGLIESTYSRVLDFVEQPDANTCQAAAIARVCGTRDVMAIRRELLDGGRSRGLSAGNPYLMGEIIKPKVEEYEFIADASLEDLKEALRDGYEIITHGWFTGSGHVIGISRFEDGEPFKLHSVMGSYAFNAEDPWYEFHFPSWTYSRNSGNNVKYSAHGIYAACVASRGVGDARAIYRRGELDAKKRNMWMHMIKN